LYENIVRKNYIFELIKKMILFSVKQTLLYAAQP